MREYHCNPCDFHISGPADEVADEIEAHEEQHHTTDTVAESGIEITPEILRAVADWLPNNILTNQDVIDVLRYRADELEREQADEKRIDELVQVFFQAGKTTEGDYNVRAGIQAVAAKFEDREQPFDKSGPTVQPLRQWGDLRDVPDDVSAVHSTEGEIRRNSRTPNGWRWITGPNVSEYGLTAHAPYTELPEGTR